MKKIGSVMLMLALVLCLLSAENNDQTIYSVDSALYQKIVKLYIAEGRAVPSTTGPWSGDELKKMVDSLDSASVPAYLASIYEEVKDELDGEASINFNGGAMEFDGTLSLDIYAHTYSGDIKRSDVNGIEETAFAGRRYWFGKDLTKNTPFFQLDWESWLGSNFYTYFNAYLSNSVRGGKEIGSTAFNSNIPTLQNLFLFDLKMLDINFPSRAFLSVGGSGWSLQIGRDRLSWGSGSTGNLVLSDNFPYHDMFRATAYSSTGTFKYTYLLSFFTSKMNYYGFEGTETTDPTKRTVYQGSNGRSSAQPLKGVALYSAHRFEGRFFSDRLSVSITEALTLDSQDGSIPILALSPLYFMHNAYMPNNTNSTLALEINWTVMKGLAVYGQVLLDNFAMPGFETGPGPGKSKSTTPDGKAFLIGAKYMTAAGDGILTVNPEAVYVMPLTYLRDSRSGYGIDYIAAVKYRLYSYESYAGDTDILYDEYVIGYTYGPDCLVASLSAGWDWNKLSLGGKFFFMAHGTHDYWTKWCEVPAGTSEEDYKNQYSGISSDHSNTGNYRYSDAQAVRNSIWYTYDIGISASYEVLDNLSVSLALDFVRMNNIYNIKGQNASDFQVILGVSYKPF